MLLCVFVCFVFLAQNGYKPPHKCCFTCRTMMAIQHLTEETLPPIVESFKWSKVCTFKQNPVCSLTALPIPKIIQDPWQLY